MPNTPDPSRRSPRTRRSPKESSRAQDVTLKSSDRGVAVSVQDRIRQWQSHGAADAIAPDMLSVYSAPRSVALGSPESSRASTPIKDYVKPSTTRREEKSRDENRRGTTRGGEGRATPTNRLDGMTYEQSSPSQRDRGKDDRKSRVQSRSASDEHRRNVTSSRQEREERRRRRREARSQTRKDSTPRVSRISRECVATDRDGGGSGRARAHETASPARSNYEPTVAAEHADAGNDDTVPISVIDDDSPVRRPSKYAETLARAPATDGIEEGLKPKKRDFLNKTKEILVGKNEALPVPSNRLPSIEAWLDEQPDPFVEQSQEEAQPAQRQARHPKRQSRRKKPSTPTSIPEDPNKIWEMLQQPDGEHAKGRAASDSTQKPRSSDQGPAVAERGHRQFSFEVHDSAQPEDGADRSPVPLAPNDTPPVGLRRREGRATKSRRKPPSELEQAVVSPIDGLAGGRKPDQHVSFQSETTVVPPPPLVIKTPSKATEVHQGRNPSLLVTTDDAKPKRKTSTHEDLMSVLSQTKSRRSVQSSRKRSQKVKPDRSGDVVLAVLESIAQEEVKYTRELCTLVDGVTPVLLQSCLSKSDSTAAAGLFHSRSGGLNFTKPIIDMGVALERLKFQHGRIAVNNVDAFLRWAQLVQKAYSDYIKVWTLGFQDVIVNLAPLDDRQVETDEGMAMDANGDVVDAEGQRVDVAYLQKRPLVRVKKLARDLAAISEAMSGHDQAAKVAADFADLTEMARRRHKEEQGRLEDEAAAGIDVTRVRDVRTMAPVVSASIEKSRRVRARDVFNMTLLHSTGQRMDSRIELILRDNPPELPGGGDVLICEMEGEGKWLLFAPVDLSKMSARKGESGRDLVLMIRGPQGMSSAWHELLALQADVPEAASEWMNMLGSNPLPPKLSCPPSFWDHRDLHVADPEVLVPPQTHEKMGSSLNAEALAALPSDIEVPIGEPSIISIRKKTVTEEPKQGPRAKTLPKLSLGGELRRKQVPEHPPLPMQRKAHATERLKVPSTNSSDASSIMTASETSLPKPTQPSPKATPTSNGRREASPSTTRPPPGYSPQQSFVSDSLFKAPLRATSPTGNTQSSSTDWTSQRSTCAAPPERHTVEDTLYAGDRTDDTTPKSRKQQRVTIGSLQGTSMLSGTTETSEAHSRTSMPLNESIRDQWTTLSDRKEQPRSLPSTPKNKSPSDVPTFMMSGALPAYSASSPTKTSARYNLPTQPEGKQWQPLNGANGARVAATSVGAAATEPTRHDVPSSYDQKHKTFLPSPLKHASTTPVRETSVHESDSDSESSESDDMTSDTSEEDLQSEIKDQATPLVKIEAGERRVSYMAARASQSVPSSGTRTLAPSDSASQGPYRRAPPPSAFPPNQRKRAVGTICAWSDTKGWELLHADLCSIVVTPGLVRVFSVQDHPDSDSTTGDETRKPLVEFDMTPEVSLRKGTGLDLTFRSPSTANSQIKTDKIIMLRSRSSQECGSLYEILNWARWTNPTFNNLMKARPQEAKAVTVPDVRETKTRSWFGFGGKKKAGYRASSMPPASVGPTDASVNSTRSAFSALRRFGQNSPFSLRRSSVVRREGVRAENSLYSSSSGTGTGPGSGSSTPAPSQAGFVPGPEGPTVPPTSADAANGGGMVNNMKITFHVRKGAIWINQGPAHLTILPARLPDPDSRPGSSGPTPPHSGPASRRTSTLDTPRHYRLPSSSHTPHRIHGDGREKRILITEYKKPDRVLLDATLGESNFERFAGAGIAMKVWTETEEIREYGGVLTGTQSMYLMQFPTSTEATWVFNMCGSYRYGYGATA